MPFTFLEHTADVQVEVTAPDFAQLLQAARDSFYAVTLKQTREAKPEERSVSIEAACREELLVRWLHELLFLLEAEGFVAAETAFELVSDQRVLAALTGYVCDPDDRADEIKAVTYHDLAIENTPHGLRVRIIYDL
jgi:SHS2 domain-containing protein